MQQTRKVTAELLKELITKYRSEFEAEFPGLTLSVHFTWNGQPPTPDEYRTAPESELTAGLFVKIEKDYRIGIQQDVPIEDKLLTFFHEYGHANYRRQIDEAILDDNDLIPSETAALVKSVELARVEGLPQIALLAIKYACHNALKSSVYSAALNNALRHPIFLVEP